MEFKELTLEELIQGYVRLDEEQAYQCIFCGERFEEGLIYTSRGRSVSAHRAMQEAGASVPMFGLAKRFEEIYLPGREDPIVLDRRSNALHLVQYVRDEAHRFDDLFGGLRVDADGEGVDPAKALEQHGLALHDGQ